MASKPGKNRQQRRIETERRLQEAVGSLILERGVEGLGVNAVARRAGVDKALVYRYFDGLEGLVRAYAAGEEFWPSLDEILGPEREVLALEDPARIGSEILRRHAQALRARPVTLEILAQECVSRGPLTIMLEELREQRTLDMFAELRAAGHQLSEAEIAVGALLSAAINYLALRSRFIRTFGSVDLGTDAGWESLLSTVDLVFAAIQPKAG
jgi:AcrR family transcriptional regulator